MTCIIGLIEDGRIIMGGDCALVRGQARTEESHPKVIQNGPALLGSTGDARLSDLLEYGFVVPPVPDGVNVRGYMISTFIPALRTCLKDGGMVKIESGQENSEGEILVGIAGHLFLVCCTFAVVEAIKPYQAVGCGASYALGALVAMTDYTAFSRIRTALQIAAQFSEGVHAPFTIATLEADGRVHSQEVE